MNSEEINALIEKGQTILQFRPKCFDYDNMFVTTKIYRANNGLTSYDDSSSKYFFEMAKEWIADCCTLLKKHGVMNEYVDTSIYANDKVVYYEQEVTKFINQLEKVYRFI